MARLKTTTLSPSLAGARQPLRPIALHRALRGPVKPRAALKSPPLGPGSAALLLVVGFYCSQIAQTNAQGLMLAGLLTLPLAALAVGCWGERRAKARPRRAAKTLIDRRPVLLRQRLVLPPGRPRKITRRLFPQLPPIAKPARLPHRSPRLIFAQRSS